MRERIAFVVLFPMLCMLGACRENLPLEEIAPIQLGNSLMFVDVGTLRSPRGIAVDPSGDVWVADTYGNRILRYAPNGTPVGAINGVSIPTSMGLDRGTNSILAITNGRRLVRINTSTEQVTEIVTLSDSTINSTSIFEVTSRTFFEDRPITLDAVGDVDGTRNGDIYVNILANTMENYLVRVTSSGATAVAFSQLQPLDSLRNGARFVAAAGFSSVYTAFLVPIPNVPSFGVLQPYFFVPGSISSSHALDVPELSGRPTGACNDGAGRLYLADPASGTLLVISTSTGTAIEVLEMPQIAGMPEPIPWDVAASSDGMVYIAVINRTDPNRQLGAVLRYSRSAQ